MLKSPKLIFALALVFLAAVSLVGYSRSSLPTIDTALVACAARASSIEVEPKQVSPTGSLEVHGEGFGKIVECDDTGFVGEESKGAVFEPRENISIELRQGSQRWELSTVDADQDLAFDEELQLPAEVAPGQATVTAKGNQGVVKVPISVAGTVTSGSLAEPKDGDLPPPPPPPAYEVKPSGDIVFGGDAILSEGCDTVAVSSSEDFPSLTEREFQDVAAQCAEPNASGPGGETNVQELPDTGGLPLGVVAAGLGAALVVGGLLVRRRLS